MHNLIRDFILRIINCFTGYNILYHVAGAILTYICVTSGFDWFYYTITRSPEIQFFMFPAVVLGSIGTFLILLTLLIIGKITNNKKLLKTSFAVIQAVLIAIIITTTYKAFTGRAHPPHVFSGDISHVFNFGFIKDSIFYGWPSSHTATAFALAVTIYRIYPKSKIKYLAMIFALYTGIGVSTNIHWFSDFIAGTLVGTAIGNTVAKDFLKKTNNGI